MNPETPDVPLIFQHWPILKKNLHWIPLGSFPTRAERLPNLGQKLGANSLWIKRDDLGGEIYGGNKVRTLEFYLASISRKQIETLIPYSALGSNWPLACCLYAKLIGISSDVVYLPYPMDDIKQQNFNVTKEIADNVYISKNKLTFPYTLFRALRKNRRYNTSAVITPPGGINKKTIPAFINAIFELQLQVEAGELPLPDYIFCPLGTGGSVAGLSIGLSVIGWPTRVMAVRVVDLIAANRFSLNYWIAKTIRFLRESGVKLPEANWGDNVRIMHHFFGPGYGKPLPSAADLLDLSKHLEGLTLDTTYTIKTLAAVREMIQTQDNFRTKHILFWNTLNSRPLNNIASQLKNERNKL